MPGEKDRERLAEYLRALANPSRLQLLYELRRPRPVSEIELRPRVVHPGENPARPISHQAVRDHLAKLRAIGVLRVEPADGEAGPVDAYVLNQQKLFAIVEELRDLGELRADAEAPPQETLVGARPSPTGAGQGPRLVLVRGQGEGRVFALAPASRSPGRGWVIGRRHGLAVALDYDPYVSTENAEITTDGAGYALVDVRGSRNGTGHNFQALPSGGRTALARGDIISVGRSHLVFLDA